MSNTISNEYLEKVRFAVRRSAVSEKINQELKDIIGQCRADLIRMGVDPTIANDENNLLVLGCVRAFVRWQFGINGDDAAANRADYKEMADNLRKSVFATEES